MSSETSTDSFPYFAPPSAAHTVHPVLDEHEYSSTHAKGSRTIALKVHTRSQSSSHLPVVLEGDKLEGTVSLSLLSTSSHIKSVSVEVVGVLCISHIGDLTFSFLEIKKELWTSQHGHRSADSGGFKQCAAGEFSWPFSIELPKTVHVHGDKNEYPLPPTFGVRKGRAAVSYEVTATVTHGLLSAEHSVGTNFIFVPAVRPSPPSEARQAAYREKQPLLGPELDPSGWKTLQPVTIKGTGPDGKELSAEFTLSLALPLSYTRGTSIPLWLVIRASDAVASKVLATSTSPVVRLRRTIVTEYASSMLAPTSMVDMNTDKPSVKDSFEHDFYPSIHDDIRTAVWWPQASDNAANAEFVSVLQGEIPLVHGLQPTCALGNFENIYTVAMYPPSAPDFDPVEKAIHVLAEERVEIATVYAKGPHPIMYTPVVENDKTSGEEAWNLKAHVVPWY